MAITRQLAQILLKEHAHKPIRGRVLLLGRQTVWMTPGQARELVEASGCHLRATTPQPDNSTAAGRENGFISDRSFFELFTDAEVVAIDHSNYEGADIIHDMCVRPPDHLVGAFDFIYNGSVLDNIFDPAAALRHALLMGSASARLFHYEGAYHPYPAYFRFGPEWFFDFCAVNQFAHFTAWLSWSSDPYSAYTMFDWFPYVHVSQGKVAMAPHLPPPIGMQSMVIVLMEKNGSTTWDKNPIQGEYRQEHGPYLEAAQRFAVSRRRFVFESPHWRQPNFTGIIV